MKVQRQVILIPDQNGGYRAEVPSVPEASAWGSTEAEALENARSALATVAEHRLYECATMPCELPSPILVRTVEVEEEWFSTIED